MSLFSEIFCFSVLNNELIEIKFNIYILAFTNSVIVDSNILFYKKVSVLNKSFRVLVMIFRQNFHWRRVLFLSTLFSFIYFHSFKSIYNFKIKTLLKYETKQTVLLKNSSMFSKSSLNIMRWIKWINRFLVLKYIKN